MKKKLFLEKILPLDRFLGTKTLYDSAARFYDFAHHIQTLWADNDHRIAVVKAINIQNGDLILDICTGTSLAAIYAITTLPKKYLTRVIGVDISTQMLQKARKNLQKARLKNQIFNINCDARYLPLRGDTFSRLISVYGLGGIRTRLTKAFIEFVRLAKINAVFSFGEMSAPPSDKGLFRRKLHKIFVEPIINLVWHFQDIDLQKYFKMFHIKLTKKKFYDTRYLGSMMLMVGTLTKKKENGLSKNLDNRIITD